MAFRFIHAADIHLDSPLLSLDEYPGAPVEEIRLATRKALGKLVDFSIESGAAFVVIAGDLFDGEWRDCNTGLYFIAEMKRLRDAGIKSYIALGNHDAANRMTTGLPWPEHIRFFDHKQAERIPVPGCDAALYGQSFHRRHVEEDLTSTWPIGDSGTFNIGVLHTSANGAPGHEVYAPCSLDSLRSRHYQYWALGHIHTRTELAREPWVVFPGNIQGRSVRECGPKGALLVDVTDGHVSGVPRRLLVDRARWTSLTVDLSGTENEPDALRAISNVFRDAAAEADGRLLAARVKVIGRTSLHRRLKADASRFADDVQAVAHHVHEDLWIELLRIDTVDTTDAVGASSLDPAALLEGLEHDADMRRQAADVIATVTAKLPGGIATDEISLTDDMDAVLADARALVLGRLAPKQVV